MLENRTIVIVDDEPETLKGYQEFLTGSQATPARKSSRQKSDTEQSGSSPSGSEQYNLLLASSGEQAVELVRQELTQGRKVAAGFFDVKLGAGMDGIQTIQEIRQLMPDIHCVIVTAYHDRSIEDIHKLFGEDFKDHWDYLNKPFTQGEIVQKARQMIAAWNRKNKIELLHQQLIRSERLSAIGQIARGVGHEFGNILLRIVGKADLALMEKDAAKIQEHIKVILSAAERAGGIARNLQTFSKSEPQFKQGNINTPLEQTLSLANHDLIKSNIKLNKKISPTPEIRLDVASLGQVFLNLIINAIHAMPGGGELRIETGTQKNSEGQEGVQILITDTGHGIPKEVLPKIFEYAFTTKGDQGSGLGLAISKEIVDAHGGTIAVQSTSQKGTTFKIWFPL